MKASRYIGFAALLSCLNCSGPSKIQRVQTEQMQAEIGLVEMPDRSIGIADQVGNDVRPDTLVVRDDDGRELIIMKAVKDENGEMVATDVISAAVVEARFRNVAERCGKVDIEFQIRVPKDMQDDAWQLRFYPEMRLRRGIAGQAGNDGKGAGGDGYESVDLDMVIITGSKYRKAQLKGYQQYERFLASIVTDTTRFIDMRQLELFIQRNIPDLYAFKTDSTVVDDAKFESVYGVTERDAVEHYTNR
ncbi:MAG: hypothetical protein J5702_01735, partial [Bacteroidales bacterium]|nr:hypothetical protein [Bacteroidales bacterium]